MYEWMIDAHEWYISVCKWFSSQGLSEKIKMGGQILGYGTYAPHENTKNALQILEMHLQMLHAPTLWRTKLSATLDEY